MAELPCVVALNEIAPFVGAVKFAQIPANVDDFVTYTEIINISTYLIKECLLIWVNFNPPKTTLIVYFTKKITLQEWDLV